MDTKTYNVACKALKTAPQFSCKLDVKREGKTIGKRKITNFDVDMSILIDENTTNGQRALYNRLGDKHVYQGDGSYSNQPPRTELDKVRITDKVTYLDSVFSGYDKVTEIDVSDWKVSQAVTICGLFEDCKSLRYLDLSGWDTSNITSFTETFKNCLSLEKIDGIIDMRSCVKSDIFPISYHYEDMFKNCEKLKGLKIKNPPATFFTETKNDATLGRKLYGYELAGLRRDQFEIVE